MDRQLQIVLKLQDEASKELKKMVGNLDDVNSSTGKVSGSFGNFAKNIAAVAASYVSFKAAYNGLSLGVRVAADLQTAQVGLETLLGSAEKAQHTVDRLKKEAARTPFELPGLTQATQLLTSVTKDGDRSIDIILDIGEALAAMGKGQGELDRIIINLQQIAATGKAASIDIKQFAFAGIPIFEMLQEETGLAGEALQDFVTDGNVTFELLTTMFNKANDEGGRFFNAFENQSGTFNQAMSNMKDSIGLFLADIVKSTGLFDGLTNSMIKVSDWVTNYKTNLENARAAVVDWIELIDQKTGLITFMRQAWEDIVMVFNNNLKPALQELWAALEPFKPYIEAFAKVLGGMFIIALTIAIGTIKLMIIAVTEVLTWFTKLATFLMTVYKGTLDVIVVVMEKVISALTTMIEKLKEAWEWSKKVASSVSGKFSTGVDVIGDALLPGRANGGHVSSGTPYIVGERGPEVFMPSGSGTIIPNGAGGGVNIYVYGDISGQNLITEVKEALARELGMNMRLS